MAKQQQGNYKMVLVVTIEDEIYTLRWVTADEDNTGWWYFEEDIPWFVGATALAAHQRLLEEEG